MSTQHRDRGAVLVVALMAMVLLSSLAAMLLLVTTTEALIAANFRASQEAFYAADAAFERVLADLRMTSDWQPILTGDRRSTFVDGPPSGSRVLADGATLDLASSTNVLNCGHPSSCSTSPRWRIYASGWLRNMVPGNVRNTDAYVVVWLADASQGPARVVVRAEAYGARGAHKVVEATVAQPAPSDPSDQAGAGPWPGPPARVVTWRQLSP